MKKLITILFLLTGTLCLGQEFKIDADLRSRYEYQNGFKTLRPDIILEDEAAHFISQRSRIDFTFVNKNENVRIGFALQDTRTWGSTRQLVLDSTLGVYEAWGEVLFSEKFSAKIGRQELVYDDSRILGNVDWAQQGRSHDLILFKYEGDVKVHAGVAYNAKAETQFRIENTAGTYKAMQFIWLNKKWETVNLSVLFLNNGNEYSNAISPNPTLPGNRKIAYSQTAGARVVFNNDLLNVNATGYYQGGKDGGNNQLRSYNALAEIFFKISSFKLMVGAELLSGTDQNATDGINRSFSPFYGTNHKFNGLMDYFFVGNHLNTVGLADYYGGVLYKKEAWSAYLRFHFFNTMGDVVSGGEVLDNNMGNELDFTVGYDMSKSVLFRGGFSFLNGTNTMQALKGGDDGKLSTWGWLMVIFKPNLLTLKKEG